MRGDRMIRQAIEECPFCGVRKKLLEYITHTENDRDGKEYKSGYSIGCMNCDAKGPFCADKKDARESWNKSGKGFFLKQ